MATKYNYRDIGEFINGVPARDLEDEDWDALDEEHQNAVQVTKASDGELLYTAAGGSSSTKPEEPPVVVAAATEEEGGS